MSYRVDVAPEVRERLNGGDIPEPVKNEIAAQLLQLEEDPAAGAYQDPVIGYARIFLVRHADFLYRFIFTLEIDHHAATVGITSVVVNPPH